MAEEIINRVAKSGIETIDLDEYFPKQEIAVLDMKDWLYMGLILKEQHFREQLDAHDWNQYTGKWISLVCTADAVVPLWAYMLFTVKLQPYAGKVFFGTAEEMLAAHYLEQLSQIDWPAFADKRVVVKGCGDNPVPAAAYVEATARLLPYAKSIMYGEPCSTVPVYKRGK
jgi:hypothetical protein